MDVQKTAPFELGPKNPKAGSKGRVLLLHGFTGSPWDVLPLGEALAADGYQVRGPRLAGHGTTPEAMSLVSARDWEEGAVEALEQYSADGPVHMAGLSMGALLSIICAARHPLRVRSLILMAPAMQFIGPTLWLVRAARNYPLIERVRPWEHKESTDIENALERNAAPVLHRFPTARLRDLFQVQETARELMPRVTTPALIVAGDHDHVVSVDGARELAAGLSGPVRLVRLTRGFHIQPRDDGREVLFEEARVFLKQYPTGESSFQER